MKPTTKPVLNDTQNIQLLPRWVTSSRNETSETVAFLSGAALTVLDALVSEPDHGVPVKLLANYLALKAATATSKLEGRLAREADIRDAYHLTPPGEARGPDGDLLAFWRQAVLGGLTGPDLVAEADNWLQAGADRYSSWRSRFLNVDFLPPILSTLRGPGLLPRFRRVLSLPSRARII